MEFPKGIRSLKPRENAPDFVIAKLLINVHELTQWMQENQDETGNVKFTVMMSKKSGKYYTAVDDFKPNGQGQNTQPNYAPQTNTGGYGRSPATVQQTPLARPDPAPQPVPQNDDYGYNDDDIGDIPF